MLIIFETTTPTTRPDVLTNTQTITANGGSTTGPIVAVTPNPSASVKLANYVSLDITKSANKASIYSGDTLVYTFQIINMVMKLQQMFHLVMFSQQDIQLIVFL